MLKDKRSKMAMERKFSILSTMSALGASFTKLIDFMPSKEDEYGCTPKDRRKNCLIYPESVIKENWDLFMVIVLMASCMTTPINLAFDPKGASIEKWKIYNLTVDLLFLVDIIVVFNSALHDEYL
jgi:hypothetical protein